MTDPTIIVASFVLFALLLIAWVTLPASNY
jgi:hypothetical protein